MERIRDEVAYCKDRIACSSALAIASKDSCARRSHQAMTALYRLRLADLTLVIARQSRE